MAKLKPKSYPNRVWHGRGFSVRVVVSRVGVRGTAFKACAFVQTHKGAAASHTKQQERGLKFPSVRHCAVGKNPRAASATALKMTAKRLAMRSGAFAGLKGGKK